MSGFARPASGASVPASPRSPPSTVEAVNRGATLAKAIRERDAEIGRAAGLANLLVSHAGAIACRARPRRDQQLATPLTGVDPQNHAVGPYS
jgi:hypothetical protein